MNKILNVNLGGYALTIDDDAYEYLHRYLDAIKSRFSASEGRDEILSDIENRMGELLSQRMTNRSITTISDVQEIIKIMGKPEDFGDQATSGSSTSYGPGKGHYTGTRTGRRLFRDEEDKVVGGVCSGLAAYFGIQDPVWVRIAFVLLTFLSGGFWIPAYLLLLVIVPAAVTSADRLAMRGEPINVDNIAREVETGFERFSNRVNDFGTDMKKKSGSKVANDFRDILATIVSGIGKVFGMFVRMLGGLTKGVGLLIMIFLVFVLIITWLAGLWSFFEVSPHLHFISPLSNAGNYSVVILGLLLTGLPVVSFFTWLITAMFKLRSPQYLQAGIWIAWSACLVAMIFSLANASRAFKSPGESNQELTLSGTSNDTLYVTWIEQDLSKYNFRTLDDANIHIDDNDFDGESDILISDDAVCINNLPDVLVGRSRSKDFEINMKIRARGRNSNDAAENARATGYRIDLEKNTLYVPRSVIYKKGTKVRAFDYNLNVNIPEGKYVVVTEGIHEKTKSSNYDDSRNNRNRFNKNPGKAYLMTTKGLLCTACDDYGTGKYESDENFHKFRFEGPLQIEMTQSDETLIDLHGASESEIKVDRNDESLSIINLSGQPRKITLKCPGLSTAYLSKGATVDFFSFHANESSLVLDGDSKVTGMLDCDRLTINMSDESKMRLSGNGDHITLTVRQSAEADLFNYKIRNATVTAKDQSKATIYAEDRVELQSSDQSKVDVNGPAEVDKGSKI